MFLHYIKAKREWVERVRYSVQAGCLCSFIGIIDKLIF